MRRFVPVLAIGALCAGCASVGGFRGTLEGQQEPALRLTRADALARDGQPGAARDLYEQLVREPSRDAVRATALYNLARLYADPASGFLDYRAAEVAFEQLLAEYPKGNWETDARVWRVVLRDLQAREADVARLRGEATKLQADLQAREADAARLRNEATKLKADLQAREADAARLKDETARLKADLRRLKQIDLNFERRR
jgi:hypothetical protein